MVTDPELYFEHGKDPFDAFRIWDGGLGIWGAIALGGIGAWIGCRRKAIRLAAFADAAAPGIIFAQALGRWGNWFNNELYGGPTSLPWKLQIHQIDVVTGHLTQCQEGNIGVVGVCGYYQPTFLYESLWDVALGVALIYVGRRVKLGQGNLFALYVMGYTVGRAWIEALREDHANHFFGVRLNDWTALFVFIAAAIWFYLHRNRPTDSLYRPGRRPGSRCRSRRRLTTPIGAADVPTGVMTVDRADDVEPVGRRGASERSGRMTVQHVHGHPGHREVSGGWLRPTVFGLMDGLVSNFALVAGIAGANVSAHYIAVGGLAGLVGGAFSMATGEYVSVQSQNEAVAAEVAVERAELRDNALGEQQELADLYIVARRRAGARGRGVAAALARSRAGARDPRARRTRDRSAVVAESVAGGRQFAGVVRGRRRHPAAALPVRPEVACGSRPCSRWASSSRPAPSRRASPAARGCSPASGNCCWARWPRPWRTASVRRSASRWVERQRS